jgi:aspartyl-tRNA synthetase
MFADDVSVSKGMVKYACGIPKESIVDVEGLVAVPANPIESCSQSQVGRRGCVVCGGGGG